jgi:ferritin-like metal-binding protein YciE
MAIENLHEVFVHELEDIYYAENRLVEALAKLSAESSKTEVKRAFVSHRRETEGHVRRLRRVFRAIGVKPEEETCQGIEGLIREKRAFTRERPVPEILDFYNVGAAQKVERYEITAYETLIAIGGHLRLGDEVIGWLRENLAEEEAALAKLQGIARGFDVSDVLPREGVEEEDEGAVARVVGRVLGRRGGRARSVGTRSDTSRRGRSARGGVRR